jgi:fibronectin-binding autotransporter adhesin
MPTIASAATRRCAAARFALALAGLVILAAPAAAQTTYTWIAASTGNFSDPANWLTPPGAPPANDPGTVLVFNSGANATQNLAANFQLNGLIFNSSFTGGSINITNTPGDGLTFVANGAANPFVVQNNSAQAVLGDTGTVTFAAPTTFSGGGTGQMTVTSPVVFSGPSLAFNGFNTTVFSNTSAGGLALPAAGLAITGTGVANVAFTGNLSGNPTSVAINILSPDLTAGTVQLSGVNNFTTAGGIQLQSGNLILRGASPLGDPSNVLIVSGGALRVQASATLANPIQLNEADLVLFGTAAITLPGPVSTTAGTGGVRVLSPAVTMQNTNSYNGPTVIGLPDLTAPPLLLSGVNGRLLNTSSITVNGTADAGTLTLSNAAGASADRVPTVPVTLNGGRITYTTGAGANSETFGDLTVNGFGSVVTTLFGSPTSTSLTFGTLTRPNQATVTFRGPVVGTAPTAATVQVAFAAPFTGLADPAGSGITNLPVIPWAVGDSGTQAASNLVTPDGNGVRPLAPSEFNIITAGNPLAPNTNNLLGGSPAALAPGATVQVNALRVSGAAGVTFAGGAGSTLRVYSGAIAIRVPTTFAVPTLDFGPRTGYFHMQDEVAVNGTITGSAGVVVSSDGNRTLTLGTANSFSGGLTVNGNAAVAFAADDRLGAAGGGITFGGGILRYTDAGPMTVSRPVFVTPAGGALEVSQTAAALTMDTTLLTGPGPLRKTGAGTLVLTGASGGTGSTIVTSGAVEFADGASFGAGPIILNGGTLRPTADATPLTRPIQVNDPGGSDFAIPSTIDVGAHNPTFTGAISTLGYTGLTTALIKQGTGVLTLTGDSTFAGNLTVAAGGLTLSGGGRLPNARITLASGGTLALDNTAVAGPDRLAAPFTMQGGNLALRGNTAGSAEALGTLTVATGSNFVSLMPAAGATAQFTFAGYDLTGGTVVFRGPNLGTTGPNSSRVFMTAAPTLVGGLIPGALGDSDPVTGSGSFLVGYSPTMGVVNVSPSTPTTVIQNPANGGTTPTDAHVLTAAPSTVTRGAVNSINSLTLAPGSTLSADTPASSTLTINSGVIFIPGGAPATVNGSVAINTPTDVSLRVFANGDATIAAPFSTSSSAGNAASFTKDGPGTLTLTGVGNVSGPLALEAGAVVVGANVAVGSLSGSGNLTVNGGSTLRLTGAGTFGALGPTFSGTLAGAGGLLFDDSGAKTLAGPITLTGPIENRSGTLTLLTSVPAGGTLTLGSNDPNALGATLAVAPGLTIDRSLVVTPTNDPSDDARQLQFASHTSGQIPAIVTGTVTLNGHLQIFNPFSLPGIVTGPGQLRLIANVDLGGANSFSGGVLISQFDLVIGVATDTSLGSGTVMVPGGAFLRADNGARTLANPVAVTSSFTNEASLGLTGTNAATMTGTLTISNNVTAVLDNRTTNGSVFTVTTIAGGGSTSNLQIGTPSTPAGAVVRLAAGGTANYAGTTAVNGGVFQVNGTLAAGGGPVTVAAAGTLGGTGTINRPVTLSGGLAPGASVGQLNLGANMTWLSGGRYNFEYAAIDNLIPGTTNDHVNSTGGLNLTSLSASGPFIINIQPLALFPSAGQVTYTIGTFATGVTGFNPATDQNKFAFTGQFGGTPAVGLASGGQVLTLTFTPVPEPIHVLLCSAAAAGLTAVCRRRRNRFSPV